MTKFITASCACGATFQREVKRGRPQVWCPACVLVPFAQRTAERVRANGTPANTYTANDLAGLVSDVPERIVNENDALDAVRVEIEAAMEVINASHKIRFAKLVTGGMEPVKAGEVAARDTFTATTALYGLYRKTKVMMPKEEEAA